tara:strand:+ start:90 stop:827 length:738 start_codon:yes stop_codon:yes gene_type:complete
MKKLYLILIYIPLIVFSQNTSLPYQLGESCSYDITFGVIKAGSAQLNINKSPNNNIYHIIGKGSTTSFFDLFFKVRDVYQTHLDIQKLKPVSFKRDVYEGGYTINQNYYFKDTVVYSKDTAFLIPENTQDMLSALFYARNLNKKQVLQDSIFSIPIFMDEAIYYLEVKYLYNEKIKTKWGWIDCLVFRPQMQKGRVFEDGEKMKIWITNDKNHLLLKVETTIWAGTIKAELVDYKGLKAPLSIIQ